jgi:hypothetical protein
MQMTGAPLAYDLISLANCSSIFGRVCGPCEVKEAVKRLKISPRAT